MKIVEREVKEIILFKEINNGCVFTVKNDRFLTLMKMQNGMNEYGFKTNAVHLDDGTLYWFEEDSEVIPLDCELVIITKEM